jgi:hypothetical protein
MNKHFASLVCLFVWRERDRTLELLYKERFDQLYRQMNPGYRVVVDSQL